MKTMSSLAASTLLVLFMHACSAPEKEIPANRDLTWTYTYLKANEGQRENLKQIVIKNWFVMDSIAVDQGILSSYELIENQNKADSTAWDFIVAVEYFTANTYADIAEEFSAIRQAHQTVKVNGQTFPQAGRVVKSETVKKHKYGRQ